MQGINMSGIKVNNMNGVNAVNAPATQPEIKNEVEDTLKDTQKPTEGQAPKAQNKHVITYIGGSEFTDSKGHKWHKHNEKTYDDNEYITRKDLHFMVQYGEMKHTVVAM